MLSGSPLLTFAVLVLCTLFCIAVSAAWIYVGGVTLIVAGYSLYVILLLLLIVLYGICNLFLVMFALAPIDRHRLMRLSTLISVVAVVDIVAIAFVSGPNPAMVAWSLAIYLNWLGLRTIVKLRTARSHAA